MVLCTENALHIILVIYFLYFLKVAISDEIELQFVLYHALQQLKRE